ncbi:S-layer homology domain-containing protein [Cohnella rhizosphaerae]|uniref:S-layer homology domain-containing protein n=1 Tax=Cohnella rhizosphaerae TaxID=1457232 RepID=A0A9X4KU98_9BACL|nr:S-layer homology domain-containing protein [Cohnella rhizosphaerae]MDG0811174.1 S-layer homology domain-containing protein [Cohnella rhizosphaerae]
MGATIVIPADSPSDKVVVELTGPSVKAMEAKEAVLQIRTEKAAYTLTASQIDLDAVSRQLGAQAALQDIKVGITIAKPADEVVKQMQDIAGQKGYRIVAQPVAFKITASSGSGAVEISSFNGYVERSLLLEEGADPGRLATGVVFHEDGSFSPVPTRTAVVDGKAYAKINSLTNSIYAAVYSSKTFTDIASHWAKDAIGDLGARLVVDGSGDGRFEPDREMTRAEFAAILVKGLGIARPGAGTDVFEDVTGDSWYYDAVALAHAYGIIDGYGDGSFGPSDTITREQAMTMTAKAMQITGLKDELTKDEAELLLAGFEDAGDASDYARGSIASSLKAGIISGRNGTTLAPKDPITRAEVAVIVQRLLKQSGLI